MPLVRWVLYPIQPTIDTARAYSARKFRRDLLAGLTVSVVEVPQAMAYAIIAGVPPEYGLYASIIQGVLGALMSSSEHIATGPTNTQSLLIASTVSRVAGGDPLLYLHLVFALTVLKGVIQLAFAAARLGDLVRYVSRTVILAVSAGGGLLIIGSQAPEILGIDLSQAERPWPGVVGLFHRAAYHWQDVHWHAIAVAGVTLGVMLAVRAIGRLLPAALLGIVAGSVFAAWMGWGPDQGVRLIGALPQALPQFQIPRVTLDQAHALLGGALALALLGSIESVAIAKSLAAHTGDRIDANREFLTQGLKNAISGFFQCIPGSVSFTRSALDVAAGAQTRFAACFNALFVATIYLLFAEQARHIPLASLAAVLFSIALGLMRLGEMSRIVRTSQSDAVVLGATLLALCVAPLEYAIFIGIFVNIGAYLRRASRLHLTQIVPTRQGPFVERPIEDHEGNPRVMLIQAEGDLFFAVADELRDRLAAIPPTGVRVIVLRLKRTHSIDSTAMHVLDTFARDMRARGGHLILCGVRPDLLTTLESYGLVDFLGRANVFLTGPGVFSSATRALQRARELVGASIDDSGIDFSEPEEPSFQI